MPKSFKCCVILLRDRTSWIYIFIVEIQRYFLTIFLIFITVTLTDSISNILSLWKRRRRGGADATAAKGELLQFAAR